MPERIAGAALLGLVLLLASTATVAHAADPAEQARWQRHAAATTIERDDWGIAHVHGRSDADAVFGMVYAQAEDDFNRVETNYINAMGRLAEAEGEAAIWQDLRMKLFIDPAELQRLYGKSPAWLRALMVAWADGLNYYLDTHPDVHPRVIRHFEPWMALSFSEGSIGGDIERVSLKQLAAFYGGSGNGGDPARDIALAQADPPASWWEPTGSNGIAIAPKLTADGHALLLINPHTSFFFRSELQMTSDEGLDAYGAATWGQFFVYQGFNRHIGWMHTSTGADVVDEFAETIVRGSDGKLAYRYGDALRPVATRDIVVPYRAADGTMARRSFTAYFTHHGPIVRAADGKWIATALMNRPLEALEQSWLRTKATDLASYLDVAELKANSSNNTLFADDKGEIAYLHPQFIPLRDDRFDYTQPVGGSDPATDWKGLTPLDRQPRVVDPSAGWVYNSNNWPYSAAAGDSPKQADFPRYMDSVGENPRGVHAMRLLGKASGTGTPSMGTPSMSMPSMSMPSLIALAFDPQLPEFEVLVPLLVADYDALPASDPRKATLRGPVGLLRHWDHRWGSTSMPTTLAVFWGDTLWDALSEQARATRTPLYDAMAAPASREARLQALSAAVARLEQDFGSWGVAWGEVNRFQRNDGAIDQVFDDAKPSHPVPFVSSRWGSLASFGAHRWPGTKRYYGTSGNSFVAVVEFGDKVRARAVTAGGESGHPESPHFTDEVERYASGNLREVYYWPAQREGHVERRYHPGE